jgi:hypothetical protein
MDRMMNKHSIEPPDDSLADDMLVNEIIGKRAHFRRNNRRT